MMKRFIQRSILGLAVGTLSLQFSCAPTPEPRLKIGEAYAINGQKYYPAIEPGYKEVGYASWYGPRFHKKRTANGEVFDKYEYTAAHKTLPLPSVVKVTNLDNGRTIKVRINDRGPFVRGRIIDMSENAAKALGFKGRGTAKVMVELDRQESLALLKDPRLRMKEATKKQVVEAYQRYDMLSSGNSLVSQNSMQLQNKVNLQQQQLEMEVQPIELAEAQPIVTNLKQHQSSMPSSMRAPVKKPQMQMVAMNLQPLQTSPLQQVKTLKPTSQPQNQQSQSRSIPGQSKNSQSQNGLPPKKPQLNQQKVNLQPQEQVELAEQIAEQPLQESLSQNQTSASLEEAFISENEAASDVEPKKISIQVASTTTKSDAERIKSKLKNFSSNIREATVKGRKYYRVQLAATETESGSLLNEIKSIGFKDAYILNNSR